MTNGSEIPCVLVVDDDVITLRFFEAAFREMRVDCVGVEDGASALIAIRNRNFDLLLIDRYLPDMNGPVLLDALRDARIGAPALATSAEVDAKVRSETIAAGFDGMIAKPIGVRELRDVVSTYISLAHTDATLLLDDSAALGSLGGSVNSLAALRALLANELDDLQQTYSGKNSVDEDELGAKLHRLRASCGFCGATALAEAAKNLQSALRDRTRDHRQEMSAFFDCCSITTARLREAPAAHR